MDLSIPAAAMEVEIVRPACAVQLMGKLCISSILSLHHADSYIGTVAHLTTTVVPDVKASLVNAQGAPSAIFMLDAMDTFSVVLCIEYLETTFY